MKEGKEYSAYIKRKAPKSPLLLNSVKAFAVGGAICVLGQGVINAFLSFGLEQKDASAATSVALIFLGAFLTGIGVFDRIARFAGAGTLVPITGFSNAVVSPAIEFRSEGLITGTAVKMFTIAGPVIVYGVTASVVYGIVYWIINAA